MFFFIQFKCISQVTNIKKKIIIFSFCCSSFSFSVFFFWTFIFHCVKKCNATVLDSDICVFVAFKSVARAYNREEKTRRRKKMRIEFVCLGLSLCWIDIFKKKCDFLFLPMKKKNTHNRKETPKRHRELYVWAKIAGYHIEQLHALFTFVTVNKRSRNNLILELLAYRCTYILT